jgi:hypothetical protein
VIHTRYCPEDDGFLLGKSEAVTDHAILAAN